MKPMIDRFESWLQVIEAYLQVRSVLRQCPASVQKFIQEMEEEVSRHPNHRRTTTGVRGNCRCVDGARPGEASPAPASPKHAKAVVFAERLQTLRKQKGLTQHELAQRVGLRQSAISMMEGAQCRPQPSTLTKLAKQLGVAPTSFGRRPPRGGPGRD